MQRNVTPSRGVPYNKQGAGTRPSSLVAAGIVANTTQLKGDATNRSDPRRLTFNNFATFNAREKKLPLDANDKSAPNTKLWQLPERVFFYCNKCRRDNIISDSIAIDSVHQIMLCVRCFTRIIRPRSYHPSRIVPFPSLLSWLNYVPSKVMEVSEDIASRPAEVVAPSADRVATPALTGGSRPTPIQSLPPSAMNMVPSPRSTTGQTGRDHQATIQQENTKHPCYRVWKSCVHGEMCMFRGAPYDLCICFLMGLCSGDEKCQLLHQHVFDLPNTAHPMPPQRREGDLEDPHSEWGKWVARKRNSPNSAEWQLWHNGPVSDLINVYAPVTVASEEKQNRGKSSVKLNFADISAALKGLQK
ncbi:hypothetical protein ERJ75_001426800 [Trypanosoma vivax]|uniref:Uncharacterized protein n=1 Tax=Trypanosoma vivax (strain Y486) TaxID=1055687 RepID=G0TUN0_TRYVY|nr:hypothetical protein TRVL_08382 [Trypanosoma vivax]KAH8606946.1 hypothetical protein ERJ75_001426800 [Trypanosoma vivax]CCC47665.1 conserved hypothetical protein [Trypanosoma vivax Y486]